MIKFDIPQACMNVQNWLKVFAWGDNDHGQQGNGTTTVNRKPALVHGLEGFKITKVACGSSHSIAWATTDLSTPSTHEPVLFSTSRDPLGATLLGTVVLLMMHGYIMIFGSFC